MTTRKRRDRHVRGRRHEMAQWLGWVHVGTWNHQGGGEMAEDEMARAGLSRGVPDNRRDNFQLAAILT